MTLSDSDTASFIHIGSQINNKLTKRRYGGFKDGERDGGIDYREGGCEGILAVPLLRTFPKLGFFGVCHVFRKKKKGGNDNNK